MRLHRHQVDNYPTQDHLFRCHQHMRQGAGLHQRAEGSNDQSLALQPQQKVAEEGAQTLGVLGGHLVPSPY